MNEMKALVDILTSTSMFTLVKLEGSNKQVGWYPLLETKSVSVGMTDLAEWGIEGRQGVVILDKNELYRYAISLLEMPYFEVCEKLRDSGLNLEVEANIMGAFPFAKIVLAGLQQRSDYWADLAFIWYGELSNIDPSLFRETLTNIIEAKWASQKVRQKAKMELRKLVV